MDANAIQVINAIQAENKNLIGNFVKHLRSTGLKTEAIEKHELNLDFYLNHYLVHREPHAAQEGASVELISDFFGVFFIRKAMWTDVSEQKSSIASVMLFYAWLHDVGEIDLDSLDALNAAIDTQQEQWFFDMEQCSEESLETWQADSDLDLPEEPYLEEYADQETSEGMDISLNDLIIPEAGSENDQFDLAGLEILVAMEDHEAIETLHEINEFENLPELEISDDDEHHRLDQIP